jgi:hypothetical protein
LNLGRAVVVFGKDIWLKRKLFASMLRLKRGNADS